MRNAINDIFRGFKNYEFWMTFGMNDIKAKYRRSKLGQLWITLSVAIFIFVIGSLYRGLFKAEAGTYLAYLAVGYILWIFISDSISAGCVTLIQAKPYLLQRDWPVSAFVYRLMFREVIVIAHHVVILLPIFLWLRLWPGVAGILLSFLGFVVVTITAFWVALFLAIVSLRYRDIPPTVSSLLGMAFFATPIIWLERDLGGIGYWVNLLNPFGYFLKIVRNPLLGEAVTLQTWGVVSLFLLLALLVALMSLAFTKRRLTYWL